MVAKLERWLFVIGIACLSGCAVYRTDLPLRIAFLAPFEGRYREVGYNAYYAIRMAFADANLNVEFLPIDDGGSVSTAVERAQSFSLDPQIHAALVMGYAATDAETLQAFADVPLIVIGNWSTQPESANVFILASSELDSLITSPARIEVTDAAQLDAPIGGGEVLALAQFPILRESLEGITIVSSGSLPDDTFRERYLANGQFTPEPGLLATLAYDAASIALQAVTTSPARADVTRTLSTSSYEGINGTIHFENGYWAAAPIFTYVYDDNRQLTPVEGVVEQR
jgi:ABC-type branched-subunit amino acid transport system substrate-binding protein